MNLYHLSQKVNNDYDTYDSCVVAAETEEEAAGITPDGFTFGDRWTSWAYKREQVVVRLIGVAVEGTASGVICASFNAG